MKYKKGIIMFMIAVFILLGITAVGEIKQYNPNFGTFILEEYNVNETIAECSENYNLTMIQCIKSKVKMAIDKIGEERRAERLQGEVNRILNSDNIPAQYEAIEALEAITT